MWNHSCRKASKERYTLLCKAFTKLGEVGGGFREGLPQPSHWGMKNEYTFQTIRPACAKVLGQEGAGEVQAAKEQKMGKRRVTGKAGGWPMPWRPRKGLQAFLRARRNHRHVLSRGVTCSDSPCKRIALAIVQRTPWEREKWKGKISSEATTADKEYGSMATREMFSRNMCKVKWTSVVAYWK